MKPFNLEEALAGKPVVNSSGTRVIITKFAVPRKNGYQLFSQHPVSGEIFASHRLDGKSEYSPSFDLFMDSTTVTKWINLYESSKFKEFSIWNSKEAADFHATNARLGGQAFPITYEE